MSETQTTELPPLTEAMTARDLRAHQDAMRAMLGEKGYVAISCINWDGDAYVGLYENWPHDTPTSFRASTWPEAIREARQWIANHAVVRRNTTIRKLALAVIDVKDQHGSVTSRLLVGRGFTDVDIAEFGVAACERAGEMCQGAPFEIVP